MFSLLFLLCSVYTPFHEDSPDTGTKVWNAVANSLILMSMIVVVTVLVIVLYKNRCYKVYLSIWKLVVIFVTYDDVNFDDPFFLWLPALLFEK